MINIVANLDIRLRLAHRIDARRQRQRRLALVGRHRERQAARARPHNAVEVGASIPRRRNPRARVHLERFDGGSKPQRDVGALVELHHRRDDFAARGAVDDKRDVAAIVHVHFGAIRID